MPFEPLRTDEKLTRPPATKKDFEAQLMHGCGVIVTVSVLIYGMVIWPYLVFHEYTKSGLASIVAFGWTPPCILGVVAVRRFSTAGASGFMGGAMAGAAFMFLRLQQTMLANLSNDLPHTEYGGEAVWLVPLAWVALVGLLCLIFVPRSPKGHEQDGDLSRS